MPSPRNHFAIHSTVFPSFSMPVTAAMRVKSLRSNLNLFLCLVWRGRRITRGRNGALAGDRSRYRTVRYGPVDVATVMCICVRAAGECVCLFMGVRESWERQTRLCFSFGVTLQDEDGKARPPRQP